MNEDRIAQLQKFKEDDDILNKNTYNTNIQRIYFLDEVHRSYDPKGSFLANLMSSDREAILIGLTRAKAIDVIHQSSLNLGPEHFDEGDDTSMVRIYRQSPHFTTKSIARFGSEVELWYKSDKNFDFETYLNKIMRDTARVDSSVIQ